MRLIALLVAILSIGTVASAQTRSVMIEDLTTSEVQAALDAGMTTAIYYTGGTHQSGPAIVLGKHNVIAPLLARRIAEELGNALVFPINPYAPAGDYTRKSGHMAYAGSVTVTEASFLAVSKDVILSALAAGFKHAIIMNEHGGSRNALKAMAETMDKEWAPKGARVFFVPVYDDGEKFFIDYLSKRNVAEEFHTPIDDASELTAVDASKYVRRDKLAPQVASHATSAVGFTFLNAKVDAAVASIRAQMAK
jgi:creatinine amidohydrolase/Fe(II)-dependent formamide hydrolase-like protein